MGDFMDYLNVILTTLLSVVVLFIITRILGYRQLSELSLFDYINGITIGSIAAELAIAQKDEILLRLISMIIYGIFALLISYTTDKSILMRKFVTGKPIVLMDRGKLIYKNFKKARLDINEFLMKCRNNGYFDLTELDTAIMEPNGRVSFIPTSQNKPVTCSDIKAQPKQSTLLVDLVLDGKIIDDGLSAIGKDKNWLLKKLRSQGNDDISNIFLVTCDKNLQLSIFEKSDFKPKNIFE